MSHFAVLVIGENAEEQLAKYDENLELPMHLVATREQIIAQQREQIESYKNGNYAEYLKDPEKYISECSNELHIKYISEEFPKKLNWTDEECYEDGISMYRESIEDGEKWCEIREDGSLWNTTNEDAKWDYYLLGGRYRGNLILKEGAEPLEKLYEGWQFNHDRMKYERLVAEGRCDKAYKRDIANWGDEDFVFFALLKDGEWHERGKMLWWAIVSEDKGEDAWGQEFRELIADVGDDEVVSVYDCHI